MSPAERFRAVRERSYPYVGGALLGVMALVWKNRIGSEMASIGVDSAAVVSATFNVMITLTAFLFSVFVLAIAPGGGFLEKIFHTDTFRLFKRYVVEALALGALSVAFCLPFMVMKRDFPGSVWNSTFIEALWVALAVSAALAFFRVVHVFMVFVGIDARHRRNRKRAT